MIKDGENAYFFKDEFAERHIRHPHFPDAKKKQGGQQRKRRHKDVQDTE
jgi:hypothetical protein